MAKYIDRDALLEKIEQVRWISKNSFPRQHFVVGDVMTCIRTAPAADVVEVRHGRWGEYESFPLTSSLNGHPCSECGMHFSTLAIPVMKYCPNCGARMDKEDEHEAD